MYLLSAVGVIFLSVIVSLLIPEGKLNKTVTFVMRMICIAVLIQPVTKIFQVSPSNVSADFFDYRYVAGEYSQNQSKQLEILLAKEFKVECECTVEVNYESGQFKVESVEVFLFTANDNLIENIYAYLQELGYINISVYAESA